MEVKNGYKNTEFGIIPEDWDIQELQYISKIIDSLHQTPKFSNEGYAMVRVSDIKTGNLSLSKTLKVNEDVFLMFTSNYRPKRNDIVLSRVGSYGVSSFVNQDEPFCMGQNTVVIVPKLNNKYIYFSLNSNAVKNQIENESFGTGYKSLSLKNIKELSIPLPPLLEQTAIAEVLSDTDNLIQALEKRIAKNRQIKQGAMQKLLTPKKDWEVKRFDEIFKKYSAKNHQINSSEYQDFGKYPVIDQGKKRVVAFSDNANKVFKCPSNGIIIFGDHTRTIKFADYNFLVGADGTQLLTTEQGYNTLLFYYLLMTKEIPNTGYNRHFKYLLEMIFSVPPLEEQTRIANILSDMDTEIETLEKKLAKYKQLKQGLMQNLLTGKIRLI